MTDQAVVDRIELLKPEQVCELGDCLLEYFAVMPGSERPNEIEAKLLLKAMLVILKGSVT